MYKPNALEVLSQYLDKNPETDAVASDMDIVKENGEFSGTLISKSKHLRYAICLAFGNGVGASFMYRKSIADHIGEYDENIFCAEDYDYWCRIALNGRVDFIDDNLYIYRQQKNSLTATKKQQIKEKIKYIRNKYLDQFFQKYKLGFIERAKLMHLARIQPKNERIKYFPLLIIFWIYREIFRTLETLFFFNKYLRKTCRSLGSISLSRKTKI
jgi:hypothetical protein